MNTGASAPGAPRGTTPASPASATGSSVADFTASPGPHGFGAAAHPDSAGSSAPGCFLPSDLPADSTTSPVSASTRPVTHLQCSIVQLKVITDGHIRYDHIRFANFSSFGEPNSVQEALADPRWKEAMDAEFSALMVNQTWHLVPPGHG